MTTGSNSSGVTPLKTQRTRPFGVPIDALIGVAGKRALEQEQVGAFISARSSRP